MSEIGENGEKRERERERERREERGVKNREVE